MPISTAAISPHSTTPDAPSRSAGAIRPACLLDARDIAEAGVAAWRESYAGILPAALLETLDVGRSTANWSRALAQDGPSPALVSELGDRLVGFCAFRAQRDEALCAAGFDGEINAMYLLAEAQGRGLGRQLMFHAATNMTRSGLTCMAIWTLSANRSARAFYEHLGGKSVSSGERRILGDVPFAVTAYGWASLEPLRGLG